MDVPVLSVAEASQRRLVGGIEWRDQRDGGIFLSDGAGHGVTEKEKKERGALSARARSSCV